MCDDYEPAIWNWKPITQGGTYPATNVLETLSASNLSQVVVTIEARGTDVASLTLDSGATGITINVATAGAWDYTINTISAATTAGLVVGFYDVTHKVTDSAGVVTFVSKGTWQILAK